MALLTYNEIKVGKSIIYEGEPYDVVESHVARTQQRKPQNQTKLRNLLNGRVVSISFHVSDKAEEAEIEKHPIKFVFSNRGEYTFCEVNNPGQRFTIPADIIGENAKFLKSNLIVEALKFGEEDEAKIIGLLLSPKIDYLVKEAAPAVKGNTAQGAMKQVTLENGLKINTPLFINEGDTITVSTQTGDYVGRAEKN